VRAIAPAIRWRASGDVAQRMGCAEAALVGLCDCWPLLMAVSKRGEAGDFPLRDVGSPCWSSRLIGMNCNRRLPITARTDKVGQDVLYLSLKSIRTGWSSHGETLVTLPLALVVGQGSRIFARWWTL